MTIVSPDVVAERITDLTAEELDRLGIDTLLLDVDNTLATHGSQTPLEGVPAWIDSMRENGITLVLVSNNRKSRVRPFAARLGLPFVANGMKPLPVGYHQAIKLIGGRKESAAAVGDQIFTDIAGGNLLGIVTILITRIQPEDGWFFRLKRRAERALMGRCSPKHVIPGKTAGSGKS